MHTGVRIRGGLGSNPPVLRVYDDPDPSIPLEKQEPDYTCTRIWMGVAPPEVEKGTGGHRRPVPGYACVVGELYENDPMQTERRRVVFDEGICLDPRDFTEEQRKAYNLPDTWEDAMRRTTAHALLQAVIALKDLWWVQRILVPPDNEQFYNYIRQADGVMAYDSRIPQFQYKRTMPFFASINRTAMNVSKSGMIGMDANGNARYKEDREWNLHVTDALLETDRLFIARECGVWWEQQYSTSRRAVGMVLNEMQYEDMTYQIRSYQFSDGYDRVPDPDALAERQAGVNEQVDVWRWLDGEVARGEDI